MSELPIVIEKLQQLERMHQLNLELLEQLAIASEWIIANELLVPNIDKFRSLLTKTNALLKELYSTQPEKTLIYRKLPVGDDFSHEKKKSFGDGDFTESIAPLYKL